MVGRAPGPHGPGLGGRTAGGGLVVHCCSLPMTATGSSRKGAKRLATCSCSIRKASWPCGLVELAVRRRVARRHGTVGDGPALVGRVQDVAADADREQRGTQATVRTLETAAAPADVVEVHGLGQHEIRVGIEAPDELVAVVFEVALDLEPLPELEPVERLDQLAAEAVGEHVVGSERDLADHPGQREPLVGTVAGGGVVVLAVAPQRVEPDDASAGGPPPDLLCRRGLAGGQGHDRPHPLRVHDGPLQRLHPAHRATDHGMPAADAERVGHDGLAPDHVADGHDREPRGVRAAVRMGRGGPGGALAAAQHVDADDEPAVEVDPPAGTDGTVPPTGGCMSRFQAAGGVAVAGEGVADQHGVRCVGVQRAEGLVGDRGIVEQRTAFQREGPAGAEGSDPAPARIVAGSPGTGGGEGAGVCPAAEVGEGPVGHGGGTDGRATACAAWFAPRHVSPPPHGRADTRVRGGPRTLGCPGGPHPRPEGGRHLGCPIPGCRTRSPGPLLMLCRRILRNTSGSATNRSAPYRRPAL